MIIIYIAAYCLTAAVILWALKTGKETNFHENRGDKFNL